MNARSEAECYTRYRATARRFELFGAATLAAGVLCYTAFGDSVKWPGVALGAVGLCAFALGAASLRPHNAVKSFALQCMQNPNEEYARRTPTKNTPAASSTPSPPSAESASRCAPSAWSKVPS